MQTKRAEYNDEGISIGRVDGPEGEPKNNPLGLFNSKAESDLGVSETGLTTKPATRENFDFLKGLSGFIAATRKKLHSVAQQIGHQIGIL